MVPFPREETSASAVDGTFSSAVVADIRWPGERFLDMPQGGEHSATAPGEIDYEGLPEGVPTSTHMLAGSVAGVMEHCLMYPVDCVKTRMQSLKPEPGAHYRNVMDALRRIVRTEGVWRPVRGVMVIAAASGPAHAMYFACYEKIKSSLNNNSVYPGANSHLTNGVAGCAATLMHDALMNPAEVVSQRMQVYNSPYRGALHCARTVLEREGPAAFYRSLATKLSMNVPFQALHFVTYEHLQELLNPRRRYDPASHLMSGALAGAVAASLTTPLDVCKTLLNTQEALGAAHVTQAQTGSLSASVAGVEGAVVADTSASPRYISGLGEAFRTVYRTGGVPAFFKGAQARIIYHVPSTAICWSVYEFFKYTITQRRQHGGGV